MTRQDRFGGIGSWLLFGSFIFALTALELLPSLSYAADTQQAESEVLVAQGVVAYDERRYDDALRLLSRSRELNPRDSRGLYYLGLTQLALKNPSEAISALEAAQQLQLTDPAISYQLGVAYFTAGRYDEAAPLLEQAFKTDPSSENLGYYVGLGRYRQKDYKQAIQAFNATKTSDPNVQQLTRFYRGLALGVLGLSGQASAELRQLEATGTNLPFTGQAMQIQQAIAAGRKTDEARRLRLQVSVGGFYSDNVAINPRNPGTTPDAGTNNILRTLTSRSTTSPGVLGSLVADYSFYRDGPLEATVNYAFLQTANLNDGLNTFNIQSHVPGISGFYRGAVAEVPFQIAAQYTYSYIFLKDAGFTSAHSPTLTASIVPPSFTLPLLGTVGNLTSVITRWQKKEFYREPVASDPRFAGEQRDAYNTMFGFVHAFRFAQDKHIVRFGYQYDNEDAAGSAFSYKGNRVQAGLQSTLPIADLIFRYDYDIHFRDYKNSQSLFRDFSGQFSKREDTQQTHSAQLVYPFSDHWSVTAQYQRIFNKSNVPLYDYVQNVYTGLLTWTY
jgi:DNA-binding SARP family transcriptional activator